MDSPRHKFVNNDVGGRLEAGLKQAEGSSATVLLDFVKWAPLKIH